LEEENMSKISVIGAGSVGATIANDLMIQGVASEIVLVDVNKKKAVGEALDIYQGAPFCSPAVVRPGEYSDTEGSDIVIITCGIARKPGMTRLDLAQVNVNILKDVAANVTKFAPNAIYVIVSNPVDVLTYVFHKISGIPENQIIGSGTILDTSRLQSTLAKRFHISPKNVHAHVYGEHGDTQFVPWSLAHIANNHVDSYREHSPDMDKIQWNKDYAEIEEFVKKSGAQIIENKGATFYAVAMSVCHICKAIYSDAGTALSISTMMHGEYGVSDVCLSTLALVDRSGVRGKILNPLTEEEMDKMRISAEKLRSVIDQIEF
jgi:L-lactate dehydrogenase